MTTRQKYRALISSQMLFFNMVKHLILGEKGETGEYADVSDITEGVKDDHQYKVPRQAPTYEQLRLKGHNSNMYEVCSPTYEQLNMEDQSKNMYDSCSPAYE